METQEMLEKDAAPIKEKEPEVLRTRRVGSVTFGLTLILFGVLFLVHIAAPFLNYRIIFELWPVTLILLGVEILVENHGSKTGQYQFTYDFAAILMLLLVLLFAMVMAAIDISMACSQNIWW